MKTIRNLAILSGLFLALFALAATGARAQVGQGASTINFIGAFTLPSDAQWGTMTLPAGEYTLNYGNRYGSYSVEVRGTAKGSPHGRILAGPLGQTSATKNALNCVREGDVLYVRALEMPDIGESAKFKLPHGVEVRSKMIAKSHNPSGKTQLAEVVIGVERAPVN
jgi:hypothetical protein